MSKQYQHRTNENLYGHDEKILDPRAFLDGNCTLWANDKESYKQPVIYGNVVIPIRMFEFAKENTEPLFYKGERCVSFSVSYWEADEDKYHSERPPVYAGKVKLYLRTLRDDVADSIRKAYRVLKRR